MVFETKKISIETLGEYLAEIRESAGLELEEAAQKAEMKPQFLHALENGDFKKLPPDVYMYGFLRNLSRVYGVQPAVLIEQYKKERGIDSQLAKNAEKKHKSGIFHSLVITPKVISIVLGGLFVGVTILYVIWQVFSINKAPKLEISEPADHQLIKSSSARIVGKTDPGMLVTINGQPVFVDGQGTFTTELGLGPGPKDLVFIAKNKFDKTVSKTITIIGEPSEYVAGSSLVLGLSFSRNVQIKYSIDSKTEETRTYVAGSTTTLEALQQVVLTTSDAGGTEVSVNGKSLGVMGRNGERLENITFTPESQKVNP